jgi:hypothetical protein
MRFEVINEILKIKFNLTNDGKILTKWNPKNNFNSISPFFILKSLLTIHIQLNEIINLMNKIFSFPIALFLGYNLFGSTFSLYETYDIVFQQNLSLRHFGYNIAIILTNLNYFIYNLITIVISVSVTRCRNETYDILIKMLHEKYDEKFKKKIRLFILQIKHSRAEFSCGMFNFDWMVLYMVN